MKNQLKELMDKYKRDVIILYQYNDDMHKVENAPLGSLKIDYYTGNGYIKK